MTPNGTELPVLRRLSEVVAVITGADSTVYLRYSHGPAHDLDAAGSRDYEAGLDMPGLSVSAVAPEPWWPRPAEEWVARRIRQYAQLGDQHGRYAWLLTGRVAGYGPDHEPLLTEIRPLGRLDRAVLDEAAALYHRRFDVGHDSTDGDDQPKGTLMRTSPSAIFSTLFDLGARLRHARVFHPDGLRLAGRFRPAPEFAPLFGTGDRAALARLSKGTGLPDGIPDILGLAIRVLDRDEQPWDFTLATTGQSTVGRFFLTPARGWNSARYGSFLPYRIGESGLTWIFAEPENPQPGTASLDAMRHQLREGLADFELTAGGLTGPRRTLGHLALRTADPGEYRADFFDPMLNHPPEVTPVPEVVNRVRELAYSGSRHGRGEERRGEER